MNATSPSALASRIDGVSPSHRSACTASALCLLAAVSACAATDDHPGSILRDDLTAVPQPTPVRWEQRPTPSGRRAVIIVADRYASDASWNLPNAGRSGEILADGLRAHCGFAKSDITTLTDRDVNRDVVRLTIQQPGSTTGEDHLLLVYYVGHGWVDKDGRMQLFTFATQWNEGRFENTLDRDELVAWLGRVQAPGTSATLIVDACRANTASPPPRAKLLASDVWEVYGAQGGRFAAVGAPGEAFPFTSSLVDTIAAMAQTGGRTDLAEVLRTAREGTLRRTDGKQEPELLPPKAQSRPPFLVIPKRVTFAVRVVDGFTEALLEQVTLRIDDRTVSTADGIVRTSASPTQHVLTASCEGYMARTETVVLSEASSGGTMTLALLPAAVLVRGRVEPAATVQLRVRQDGPRRDDYHVMSTTTRANGVFELRVPRLQGELEVLVDERVARTVPLPSRATGLVQQMSSAEIVVDISDVPGLGHAVADAPSVAPTFTREIDRKDWERVVRNVQAGHLALARATITTLPASIALDAWSRWIDNRWVEQCLREGLRAGIDDGTWVVADDALAWLSQHEERIDDRARIDALRQEIVRERIPLANRQAIGRAHEAYVRGDFDLAWSEYHRALDAANVHYRASILERLEIVGAQLYDRHMNAAQEHESNGDLEQAAQAYNRAGQFSERAVESLQRVITKMVARARAKG